MEFSEVEKQLKSVFPFLSSYDYDGIIVKKLEPSNTWDSDRTTKQTHIAITGEQMDIFPYLSSEGYFNCTYSDKDDALKKYFITMIPIVLHKENLIYLNADVSTLTSFNTLSCVIRGRRDGAADQIQFALPTYDDKLFVLFRQHIHAGYYLVLLKRKNEFLYDSVALKEDSEKTKLIEQFNNHFYKLPTNTKIDISNFIRTDETEDLSIEDLGNILKDSYNSAGENQKVVTIHVFGIKFGKLILKKGYKINEIISNAGLNSSYATEVSKGIGIYKYFAENFKEDYNNLQKNQHIQSLSKADVKTFFMNKFTSDSTQNNYIKSLLAKPFVILTGSSGTGKTRVSINFATYLEKRNDSGIKNHLLIPVGADWTDNTKIFGFYNPLKKEYQSTPVLDFILLAGQYPDIPFFLILDEMNLSHVERYFSDFLSAMESGEPIPLYKKDADCKSSIPDKIVLPNNLFVTGTVNIDETTYMFSPKVLDRANVIEFKPEMTDVLNNLVSSSEGSSVKQAESGVSEGFMKLANDVRSGNIPDELNPLLNEMKPIFETFYKELEKYGFEFAYRTVKEIKLYTIAAWLTAGSIKPTAKDITDVQVLQKILPKIHGNRKQIGELLDNLEKLCNEKGLNNSLIKIRQMKDHLNRFQYASFI